MAPDPFTVEPTADGSATFYSETFGEWFHSRSGAYDEARSTYVQATHLVERAQHQGRITILDVCYGLGYNTAAALEGLWAVQPGLPIRLVGLELDATVPQAAIAQGLLKGWPEPVQSALQAIATDACSESLSQSSLISVLVESPAIAAVVNEELVTHQIERSPFREGLKGINRNTRLNLDTKTGANTARQTQLIANLLVGDARQQIQTLVEQDFQADVIFLDPFSPPRCPQLWTAEFLGSVARCLHPQGILATYSCAAAVRTALTTAGLHIGSLATPGRRWPSTLASHTDTTLPPLSQQEQEHLQTRAAVPYRDPSRQDDAALIQQRRSQEQAQSPLQATGEWRRRWLSS